jgi:uncharacterized LabA/DUF88 family protein
MASQKRMMVFIDGENLVARFQAMIDAGRVRDSAVAYDKDVFVWGRGCLRPYVDGYDVIRVSYYTSVLGDESRIDEIERFIGGQQYLRYGGEGPMYPVVLQRRKNQRQSKGLDIRLCVDVLTHVHRDNTDSVLLLTGDGDFAPLIREVMHSGKQIYVRAFSDGLNPILEKLADGFSVLDNDYFLTAR